MRRRYWVEFRNANGEPRVALFRTRREARQAAPLLYGGVYRGRWKEIR
jgi:hypothetical protein